MNNLSHLPTASDLSCKSQQLFRLHFQRHLINYLLRDGSLAEGFGIVWERTLADVPLDEEKQGDVYRELISWAKSDKLFTREHDLELVHPSGDAARP